ncbi:hypothetical protein B0I35DRAFT_213532 [Stachybotrys elegans]|uniref:Uncharacterized protein n=1 Tax=Stachybotrys elegans TaxID=80388 RepID=A0A8K0SQU6_9HYPO|nr:hypothetical protein B0I35DRAFT_213532 [Stachybotrys elegans]
MGLTRKEKQSKRYRLWRFNGFLFVTFHLFSSGVRRIPAPRRSLIFFPLFFLSWLPMYNYSSRSAHRKTITAQACRDCLHGYFLQEFGLNGTWISGKIGHIPTDWSHCIIISRKSSCYR